MRTLSCFWLEELLMFISWEVRDNKDRLLHGGDCSKDLLTKRQNLSKEARWFKAFGKEERALEFFHQTMLAFAYLGTMPSKSSRK